MQMHHLRMIGCLFFTLVPFGLVSGDEATVAPVSYHRDIKPIFVRNCLGCHQDAKPQGDYVMTRFDALVAGGETGEVAIVAGDPDRSYLLSQVVPVDGVAEMPKQGKPLSEAEIEMLRRWIAEGAQDDSPAISGPLYSQENPPIYERLPSITSIDAAGDLIAVAGFHEILLLNPADGQTVGRLVGMSERIESVRFSPDGTRVAAVGGQPGRSGEVQIWSVPEQTLQLSVGFTYDTLRGVSWSPDGTMVAFGATDNVVRAIDASSGELRVFQGAHEDWVLGTAFTGKSDYIVSVARDMTCKLTETATERFIDNITSITPGALRGGLSSVIALPGRDEILVGGADGTAKVYRVFRATARKIGDDANLLRTLPALPGRIFSVDISDDLSRLMALATIDGTSELRIWKAREQAEVPADIQAIIGKEAGQRSTEEREKLAKFVRPENEELAKLTLDVPAYAACFLPSGELAVAGADGMVRIVDGAGQITRNFPSAPLQASGQSQKAPIYVPRNWHELTTAKAEDTALQTAMSDFPRDQVVGIDVSPADSIQLRGPFDSVQVLVHAIMADGQRIDVTRIAKYEASEQVAVMRDGFVRPMIQGEGKLRIQVGSHTAEVPVAVQGISDLVEANVVETSQVDFIRDVNPVLTRLGCNQGTCHGAQKGKNGFKLSLRGYDPIFDIRALTDDLSARRINLASPSDSLMLLKALGQVPHEGGALVEAGSPYHGILHSWIASGAALDLQSPRATQIEIQPKNPVVQKIGSTQQVRVIATYPDGSTRDVTREAFLESGNTEVAASSPTGLLTALRRGEAAILARYEGNYVAATLTVMGPREEFQWVAVDGYGRIDELVAQKWERMKIQPSEVCDDATYLRRVYLDLTGLPPSAEKVREFLADPRPAREKRMEVVDQLLAGTEYVDYWTNKWADLLQVNRKFLGAEGSAEFRDWIRNAIAENRPYDQFAREILTSEGSNKLNPAASYYKILRNPEDTMENTTHLFLGVRFNCNKCHDHPFERWTQDQYYETAAFFAKTRLRKAAEAGDKVIGGTAVEGAKPLYEEVYDDANGHIDHPRTGKPVVPAFPYECDFETQEGDDDRDRLARWITSPDNQYFARSYVNRLWGYLLGVGLIEPIDDIRAGNPPTNPALLDYLTDEFVTSGFDVRHMMQLICNSRTYQLSVSTNRWNEDDRLNYSHALPRRLPAEVLYDAIHYVTGATSNIPGVPAGTRAAALPDVGVATADGFLANLGRPVRESACECERSSELQLGPIMALVSGPTVGSAIASQSNDLPSIVQRITDDPALVDELFVRILNRPAQAHEVDAFLEILNQIDQDHAGLVKQLEDREEYWKNRLPELEQEQRDAVGAAEKELAEMTEMLRPEREKAEQDRNERIAAAEAALQAAREGISGKVPQWEQMLAAGPEWFLLRPSMLSATAGNVLRAQSDRSIVASGSKEKGIYEVTVETKLPLITGFRLEALPAEGIVGGGPGFPENGNFVVTEFEVFSAPLQGEGETKPLKIASGKASFTQQGFAVEQAFNGNATDQQGWAVSPAGGVNHWATFTLAEPLSVSAGVRLTFKIHQVHNAAAHRLARFRISATNAAGPLPLGLPEDFAAILASPKEVREENSLKPLFDFLAKTDEGIKQAEAQLGVARTAIPEDVRITALKRQIVELQKPIAVDSILLRLREDVQQSEAQLGNRRLTAAEDLTWALINSPSFLFNR